MSGKLVALTLQLTLSLQSQLCPLHHPEDVGASTQAWPTSTVIQDRGFVLSLTVGFSFILSVFSEILRHHFPTHQKDLTYEVSHAPG